MVTFIISFLVTTKMLDFFAEYWRLAMTDLDMLILTLPVAFIILWVMVRQLRD